MPREPAANQETIFEVEENNDSKASLVQQTNDPPAEAIFFNKAA
jgi:hypothetical protein